MKWQGSPLKSKKTFLKARTRAGQISILIVFSLLPMFTLLAFVINIGMLVNAKIMLQNAADLGAYAGAATQARLMTDISHLNYQMRQVYKKFIYKYYVIGNMSQKCFPRPDLASQAPECSIQTNSPQPFNWVNHNNLASGGAATGFPGVPAVCISLSRDSNPCQLATAVPVVQPPPCQSLTDHACIQLQNAAKAIADIQHKSCFDSSTINMEVIGDWVYATNFDSQLQTNANLQGLVSQDVGLVTDELLLKSRIDTLAKMVNTPPQTVTMASMKNIENNANPVQFERTTLAFRTIDNNLNRNVFEDDTIEMSELWDGTLLNLQEVRPHLNVAFTTFDVPASGGDCNMAIDDIVAEPIVAVFKNPDSHVHYAIKATAKAKLLFNPFPFGNPSKSIELTAYAAAMPFGSRIGPVVKEDDFVRHGTAKIPQPGGGTTDKAIDYPALNIDDQHTYESQDVLFAFYNNLQEVANTNGTSSPATSGSVGTDNLQRGIRSALLPDKAEVGRYNIPVDSEALNGKTGFLNYFSQTVDDEYTFWAPVIDPTGPLSGFRDKMQAELTKMASTQLESSNESAFANNRTAIVRQMGNDLDSFLQSLKQRGRSNVFGMLDPLSQAFFVAHQPRPNIPGKILGTVQTAGPILATSYTTDHDGIYAANGRDGYSVKMMPFKVLLGNTGKGTNEGNPWPAIKGILGGARDDLSITQH